MEPYIEASSPHRTTMVAIAAPIALILLAAAVLTARDGGSATSLATDGEPASVATIPAAPEVMTITGTATWPDPDERATLMVGACPVASDEQGCPTMLTTATNADGSFGLTLPPDGIEWRVAAFVATDPRGCVFDCDWRGAELGLESIVTEPTGKLHLAVSARVVDVYVVDRDGAPFAGGGVQVHDVRCPDHGKPCAGERQMFTTADAGTGLARLVLHPDVTYELTGQASNTGWSDPQWTKGENEFWFSQHLTTTGRDLAPGATLIVDGRPS